MSTNSTVVTTTPTTTIPSSTSSITTTTTLSSSTVPSTSSVAPTTSSTTSHTTSVAPSTTTTVPASSTGDTTSVSTAPSAAPSTQVITSIITTSDGSTISPTTVVITTDAGTTPTASSTSSSSSSSSSSPASLQNQGSSNGSKGLSSGGKTAIAVVVPVVVVALLVLAALFFWRKRKQRKSAEEERRKEVEEYGYNPNSNPTLPALATDGQSEMAEDSTAGYRGWGGGKSARNPSTTLSAGNTQGMSDAGSNPGGISQSPTAFGGSEGQGSETYKHRDTMNSDDLAALGSGPAANANRSEMRRGPSNASSSYSAGHRSEHSDPSITQQPTNEGYGSPQGYGYSQTGPYGDGSYGGGDGMPVVRDVSARRNTRIEQGGRYQQGNSGIAQNF